MSKNTQAPIDSGFTAASTTRDVIRGIDLSGKTAIVTGGYSGLGLETAKTFAEAGAKVIVPARDLERAKKALNGISNVEIEFMDLLDPASIAAFSKKIVSAHRPVHLLVNSAAIMATPLMRDKRGYEAQFATNHLGHFQLVRALMPSLQRADGARVVSVSSLGHRYSQIVFEDPHFDRRPYDPWQGYGQSKTANILFAVELDRRAKDDGIRAFSLHPGGIVTTNLGKHLDPTRLKDAGVVDQDGNPILDPSKGLKTVEQGAATMVWAATSPKLIGLGGLYCENVEVAPVMTADLTGTTMADVMRLRGVLPYAIDPVLAERLWVLSEKLVLE